MSIIRKRQAIPASRLQRLYLSRRAIFAARPQRVNASCIKILPGSAGIARLDYSQFNRVENSGSVDFTHRTFVKVVAKIYFLRWHCP